MNFKKGIHSLLLCNIPLSERLGLLALHLNLPQIARDILQNYQELKLKKES
jgi:hypothetical protein